MYTSPVHVLINIPVMWVLRNANVRNWGGHGNHVSLTLDKMNESCRPTLIYHICLSVMTIVEMRGGPVGVHIHEARDLRVNGGLC